MKGLLYNLFNESGDSSTKTKIQDLTHSIVKNSINTIMAVTALHKISNLESLNNFKNEALLEEKLMNLRNTLISKSAQDHMLIINLLENSKIGIGNSQESKIYRNEVDGIGALIRSNYEKRFIDLEYLRESLTDTLRILDPYAPSLPIIQSSAHNHIPIQKSPIKSINHTVLQNTAINGEISAHKTPQKSTTKYYMIDDNGNRIEIDNPEDVTKALNNQVASKLNFDTSSLSHNIPQSMRTPTKHAPGISMIQNQPFTARTPTRGDNLITMASPYKAPISTIQQHPPLEISNLPSLQTPQQPHISTMTRYTGVDGTSVQIETSNMPGFGLNQEQLPTDFNQFNASTLTIPKKNGELFRMINDAKEDFSNPIVEFFETKNCKGILF